MEGLETISEDEQLRRLLEMSRYGLRRDHFGIIFSIFRLESGSPEVGGWRILRGSHSPSPPSPMAGVGSHVERSSSFGRASPRGRGNPPLAIPSTPPRGGRGFRQVDAWNKFAVLNITFSQNCWRSGFGGMESNVC